MLDDLQKALDSGGIKGLAAELGKLNAATTAAAASQTRFAAIIGDPAVRGRVVDMTRMNQLLAVQAKLTRDQIALEVRGKTVRDGSFAKQLTALRAIERQTRAVGREEERVRLGQRLDAVRSGEFRADDRADRELAREAEKVKLFEETERLKNRKQDVRSGAYAMDAQERQSLQRQQQMVALAERESLVKQGAYAEELKGRDAILRKQKEVEALEKRAGYEARMGRRLGGIAANLDAASRNPILRALLGGAGGMAMAAGAAATGGAAKGFQGTVEWNRLQLELQMVSRELAGAFLPAIQFATRELGAFRSILEGMSPGQQNAVMYGGLALSGVAAGKMLGVGGMVSGAIKAVKGTAAVAAGGLMGMGNWGGVQGLPPGAAPATGPMGRAGALAKAGGRLLGRLAPPVAMVAEGIDAAQHYRAQSDKRVAGLRLGSYALPTPLGDLYRQGTDSFGGSRQQVQERTVRAPEGANPDRRRVTWADAGFEASGSAFERVTNKLALTGQDAGDSQESLLRQIRDLLAGGDRAAQSTPRLETR